jgi:NADH dehydrogenase FAD-containing subunit
MQVIEFDYCVIASGSAYTTSGLWKVYPSISTQSDADVTDDKSSSSFTVTGRINQLTAEHEMLFKLNSEGSSSKNQITVLGAGLVGVELTAELCTYYPNLCQSITLYDLGPTILPSFPPRAKEYVIQWLTQKGVKIVTNAKHEEMERAKKDSTVLYSCIGVTSTASSFMPASTIIERGEIAVNAALQVVHDVERIETGLALENEEKCNDKSTYVPPSSLFGSGRIFAVGDCVRVEGLSPFTKDTYPAEAMAKVVVRNLVKSLNAHCTQKYNAESHLYLIHPLMQITLCSLGPHDCIFTFNGMYIANGKFATFVKETIQYTKMSEARNEFLGTAVWSIIPHM